MDRVYLDNAATTCIRPEVLDVMTTAYTSTFGNPSSVHREGQRAKKLLEEAKESIASLLHCEPSELFFTSGGTESDNWAIRCSSEKELQIITSSIEHAAVLRSCEMREKEGSLVIYLPVDSKGRVSPHEMKRKISPDTSLVSVMLVNNEIGTIEPIQELAEIAHENGALFHTDAVQAVGSLPVDFQDLGVDLLSFSAHKFYGPRGIGGLCVKKGTKLHSFVVGGAQEFRSRAGTENLPAILGMEKALRLAEIERETVTKLIRTLSVLLRQEITKVCPQVLFHGDMENGHPGIVNLYVPGMDGEKVLLYLDLKGFACSGGAACSSKDAGVSHVLAALGVPKEEAKNSIRVSIGANNTQEEILSFVKAFASVLKA